MLRYLKTAMAICLLASCTTMDSETGSAPTDDAQHHAQVPSSGAVDASAQLSTSAAALAKSHADDKPAEPTIYRGSDTQVNMPKATPPVTFVGEDVSLNFEGAPLSEVMQAIMGDILQLDYVVDRPVQGEVTLRTRTPIPRSQLLEVLESLLVANNALMVKGADGRYFVTSSPDGNKVVPTISSSENVGAGYSTIIVPLRYISASNMAEILHPVADDKAFLRVDNTRNILMLAGTRDQLNGWLDIVNTFDVDQLKGMSVGMFPLENTNVEDAAEALTAMLDSSEQSDVVRVVPVKRLNSLLVVTPRSHNLDSLAVWIKRLDTASNSKFEKTIHVYPVQNTSARRLAELLNALYADQVASLKVNSQSGSGRAVGMSSGVAPGMSPESIGSGSGRSTGIGTSSSSTSGFGTSSGSSSSNVGSSSSGSGTGGMHDTDYSQNMNSSTKPENSVTAVGLLADAVGDNSGVHDVRIVADDENNSLIIHATGKQYEIIQAALEKLDAVATQVIIEASILEVTLTDDLRYGLEWTFSNGIGNQREGTGLLANALTGPAAVVPGFSYAVTNTIGDIKAVLNALSEKSLINVISTPSVMVLDNNIAYIHVGDQVPIVNEKSTVGTSDTAAITQSVSYKDTGVQLRVKPSVNAGGLVTMDIEQSVTDVGPIDTATGQRAFLERNIQSRVAVRSNQSVVLGGLIRENASKGNNGVPFLHTLPVVGPLFGTVNNEDQRTELLVIITPRALVSEHDLREVGEEMRSKIRHMDLIDAEK
jgi:general secretion pathway protein D